MAEGGGVGRIERRDGVEVAKKSCRSGQDARGEAYSGLLRRLRCVGPPRGWNSLERRGNPGWTIRQNGVFGADRSPVTGRPSVILVSAALKIWAISAGGGSPDATACKSLAMTLFAVL